MEAQSIDIRKALFQQLETIGVEVSIIPRYIKDMIYALSKNPSMFLSEVNNRLHQMGWDDIEVDYHTLQLAKANFEMDGSIRSVFIE